DEETQALVLPLLERVEISGIVVDQRLDEGAPGADVPGLVADPRPMGYGRQDVAARLCAVGEHREGARAGGALGDEVTLHENFDGVFELEQVAKEAARGSRRLPRGQPVALGNACALESLPAHLQGALLVGQLEQRALLQLAERRVGRGGRYV